MSFSTINVALPVIGYHRSPLSQKFGAPRQPNLVAIASQIEMIAPYDVMDAFMGIEQYSHLWILWQFHHNKPQKSFRPQVRPPRLGGNQKLGVFATRSMYRPSGLGLSVVSLKKLTATDNGRNVILHIEGADMIDGTPIVDIKPYLPYSDSIAHATSSIDIPIQKSVSLSPDALATFHALIRTGLISDKDMNTICHLIAQDPRPAYLQNDSATFSLRYGAFDVDFFMDESGVLMIKCIRQIV